MKKTIVIIGVTGTQGGSVARRFSQDPNYHIRGLTRNPNSAAAQALSSAGVEIITANLDDVSALIPAFKDANLIFAVTNYGEPFFRPDCRAKAAELGISAGLHAYNIELQQGKNIADAAASTVKTLDNNGFIVSTQVNAEKCSQGKFKELYNFDAKAHVFPDYVDEKHPELAAKMSSLITGVYMTNYNLLPSAFLAKTSDGTIETRFPTSPDAIIPHFAAPEDTGSFVYAISQMPPGKAYLAAGTFSSWRDYMATWAKVVGSPSRYRQISRDEILALVPDPVFALEVADMFDYFTDPGHDGGRKDLLRAEDLEKAGIPCPVTTLEEFMRKQDWSHITGQLNGTTTQ